MELSSLPQALSYAINRMNGTAVNTFQINSTSASSVLANSQIRFLLPTSGMVDFKTLRLHFAVEVTDATGSNTGGARLPAGIKHLFNRVQVQIGGVTVAQGTNFFGVQSDALSIVNNKPPSLVSEHGEMVKDYDYAGTQIAGGATGTADKDGSETYSTGLGKNSTLFSIDLGDVAKISPRIVPLDLMGQVEIIFYTAPNSVLSAVKGNQLVGDADAMTVSNTNSTAHTYTITKATLLANMYSLEDGAFSMAVASRIRDQGFIEMCFPQHLAFSQAWNGSARFALSAMSLNKLHALWRRNTGTYAFATVGGALPVAGGATKAGDDGARYNWQGAVGVNDGVARFRGRVQHFSAPTLNPGYNDSVEDGTAMNYGAADVTEPLKLQYKINSAQVPNFQANQSQWAELTKWANNVDKLDCQSTVEYLFNKFVISYPLELPRNAWEPPAITGLDTRSTSTFITLEGTGNVNVASQYDVLILAEVSTLLRIGAGKSLEVLM